MTLAIALALYALAMTAANLSIAAFGPWVSPLNAFLPVGLDLTLRDWLHVRLRPVQMFGLIAGSGLLTYALNPSAGQIALASACAFTAAAAIDWIVFSRLRGTWTRRAMWSNVAGAAVDSLVFPTMAFGGLMPGIVVLQFVAKVAGGALWATLWVRLGRREGAPA